MQKLNDEYCEVLEAVRVDCHRHGLNPGLGAQLDLGTGDTITKYKSLVYFIKIRPDLPPPLIQGTSGEAAGGIDFSVNSKFCKINYCFRF